MYVAIDMHAFQLFGRVVVSLNIPHHHTQFYAYMDYDFYF